MKKYYQKKWNRENMFFFINQYGNIVLDFADERMNEHFQLAEVGNFFWTRKEAEIARRAIKKTLERL